MESHIDQALRQRLDAVIDAALAENRLVGAVLLVLRNGVPCYSRNAGLADRETARPMQMDVIFRLASLTKPIVTTAVMCLVEQGKLRLDDPIDHYLPMFRPHLPDGTAPRITLHHLLTHTAGLSYGFLQPADGPYLAAGISDGLDQPGRSFADNLRRIGDVPLSYVPGSKWGYSVALDVLGAALEQATGETLPALVRRLVTAPLGMVDTDFISRDADRLAAAYGDGNDESKGRPVRLVASAVVPFAGASGIRLAPDRFMDAASFPSAGGGMLGTALDFAKLLEAIRLGGGPILRTDTVARMMQPQIGDLRVDMRDPGWSFGYGWAVLKDPVLAATPFRAGTLQWGGVYGHSWFVDPVSELTVIGLTNTAVAGMTGAFPLAVRNAIYGV
jgi:CubicO group peptidase (beta-lactamase class C family)